MMKGVKNLAKILNSCALIYLLPTFKARIVEVDQVEGNPQAPLLA